MNTTTKTTTIVRLSDLWSGHRPGGIRFLCNGLFILPSRAASMSPLGAILTLFLTACAVLVVAVMSPGGAVAVIPPALLLTITFFALSYVILCDAGALPIHVSTLVGPACGPREFARTEIAPIASLAHGGGEVKFCLTCRIWRLPGSRHCSTCGHCVAGYDHHCGGLGRCVGEGNLQAFTILVVSATLTGVAMIIQCIIALYKGVAHSSTCPSFSITFLLSLQPIFISIALALFTCGALIFLITFFMCARSRVARFGNTLLFFGATFIGISFFIHFPPCSILLPSIFTLIFIAIPIVVNIGAIAINHASGLAMRAKMSANARTQLLDGSGNGSSDFNGISQDIDSTSTIITSTSSVPMEGWVEPRLTFLNVFNTLIKALITRGPPPRVNFRADCTLMIRAIENANIALFRAAENGTPLECGSISWRGGDIVRDALIASLQQSSRLIDVETYASMTAKVVPRGVLAGNDTWPQGLQPAADATESTTVDLRKILSSKSTREEFIR
jgi:hypothetical protein